MQRLLWIGNPFFSSSLQQCGWDVCSHNFNTAALFSWDDIVRMAGWEPDVVVVADKSRPPFVLGMEDFPCLTVFYAVDSHIHSVYPLYAQGFDVCLVSLRDHIPQFLHKRLGESHVWWFPPYARDDDVFDATAVPQWDCLFVGSTDAVLLPKRAQFLHELKSRLPALHIMFGDYRKLFGLGRVLLNQCEGEDLNFRVFEALGCGGCLVTPRVGHGLTELFVDGEHLVMYEPHNVADALQKIELLLTDDELIRYIAEEGIKRIDAGHRAVHRARTFTDNMCDIFMDDPQGRIAARRENAHHIREQWLSLPYLHFAENLTTDSMRQAYLRAAKGTFAQ